MTLITAPGGHSLVVDAFMSVSLGERAVGDHALVTCKVLETTCDGERRPLVFFGGAFGSFAA